MSDKKTPSKHIFVEPRSDGRFAVKRPHAKRSSDILPTQGAAIRRAKKLSPGSKPHIARNQHTSKGKANQFRKK